MTLQISAVPPESVPFVWSQLSPIIGRALQFASGDSTTLEQFYRTTCRGDFAMWAVHDGPEAIATMIFEVQQRDALRVLFIHVVAGRDMASWVDEMERLLMDYRDLIGADTIETLSRDGMARRLLRRGWRRKATLMSLEKSNG